jgi:hypothetical protein
MPLIRSFKDPRLEETKFEDVRLVKQLDGLKHRRRFVREMASAILPGHESFESVLSIANLVYDRHCLPAVMPNRRRLVSGAKPAMSA